MCACFYKSFSLGRDVDHNFYHHGLPDASHQIISSHVRGIYLMATFSIISH